LMKDAAKGLRLKVETQDRKKENITVYAGPKAYFDEKKINFSYNDEVKIKGCWTKIDDKKVFMASSIDKDDKKIELYDKDGKPRWDADKIFDKEKDD
jgi:hypothetical protein